MKNKTYVYIGNWSFNGAASKGITIFEYELFLIL